ncbi:MAG: flagellar protein [Lachnospiraceae bacterium]|nr:flagellar protein [Lachnospiraceae bacterium]
MEVRTCRSCGKLYNYLGRTTPMCPACMKALEEKFQIVKEYIRDNPGANIQQVSDDTEVAVKVIKQWVREERLTFAEGSGVGLECENCGASILTGRFCANCKNKVANDMNGILEANRPKPVVEEKKRDASAKMRFLDN